MTTNIYAMADTWNAGGTTFTAIKMDVTDTASAAGSLLMDLQVGGVYKERTSKAGIKTLAGGLVVDLPVAGIGGATITTSPLVLYQNSTQSYTLELQCPTGNSNGAGIRFFSDVGGTLRTAFLTQDNGGNLIFRQNAGTTYFDFFAGAIWRDAGFVQRFSVDASGIDIKSGQMHNVRVVTAAGAVTMATTDSIVVVNKTVGAATTVNLTAGATKRYFVIKDGKGDAATNNITITPAAGNIDGAATLVMNVNYQSVTLVYNGTEWNVF